MALSRLVLLALVAGAIGGPLNTGERTTQCARSCAGTTKFAYEVGKTYEYQYESDLKTHIPGATEEQSGLHLTATAHLEVLSQCELALRLSDVSLEDSHPSEGQTEHVDRAYDFKRALQEKGLRFSFQDGHVQELCPDVDEQTWVLNVKRGILSAFQNTMPSLDTDVRMMETDVAGICPVEYKATGSSWGVRRISKVKDIYGCRERTGFETAFQATPYKVQSSTQSLPLLKTTNECQQEVNSNGLLVKTECTEEHLFRPFSKHHSGAATQVSYTLTFHRENSDVRTQEGLIARRESLLFEHVPTAEAMSQSEASASDALREICEKTSVDVRPEVPGLFMNLVQELRHLDTATLSSLYRSVATNGPCEKAQTFFADAIPMLGSTAAIALIRDLIVRGEARGMEADLWLTSMAFIKTPTADMLTVIRPLLDVSPANRKAYLAVSSLVNTYCRAHPSCHQEVGVVNIISKLEANLRYNCRSSNDEEYHLVMMSLKAIGNTGHADQTVPTLNRCVLSAENPMEIRIAATQAFRRMGCSADHTELMNVFKSADQCSELRINAYLAIMQCPSQQILMEIGETLATIEINQVGSFVWTHLTNLQETSDPHRQEIRNILQNVDLQKAFDMDKRKFSRNVEWSTFSPMLNAGAKVESNVIWSSKSYIPRSAMVNLTVDVLGEAINFIELGGRVDGLENVFERLFGPKPEENQANEFDSTYSIQRKDKPAGSYYLKIFGNEIRYSDFRDMDLSSLQDRFNYLDWLISLADQHNIDVTKSVMFLDSAVVVPTGVGLPLKLSVDGTAVMDVKVEGRIDLRKIASSPRGLHIGGSIKPSAAVQVNSHMGVDAQVARTGLQMSSTLHTSTVTDGLIELRDGQIFNMDINVPQDKIEIFSAETKFYVTYRGEEREQQMLTADRVEKSDCLAGKLVNALGLELCGEISFPQSSAKSSAPWFPLTGPAKAKAYINKRDTFTGYHLEATYQQNGASNGNTDTARISFNTPESRYDREMTVDINLDRPAKTLHVNVRTPWKKAEFTGSVVNDAELKRITGRTLVDDSLEYIVTSEVQIQKKRLLTEYRPKLLVSIPRKAGIVDFSGTVAYRKNRKMEVDFNLVSPLSRQPLSFKGGVNGIDYQKRTKYDGSLEFVTDALSGKFSLLCDTMRADSNIYKHQANLEYTWTDQRTETFFVNTKVIREPYKHLSAEHELTTTLWPQYNSRSTLDIVKEGQTHNGNLQASWGQAANQRLSITTSATYDLSTTTKTLNGDINFQFPYKGLDYTLRTEHLRSPNELKSKLSATYGSGREAVFDVHLLMESRNPLKAGAEIRLRYPRP